MSISINISTEQLTILVDKESMEEFRKLIARGMNTWQDASPEMERFSELVQFGRVVTVALYNI